MVASGRIVAGSGYLAERRTGSESIGVPSSVGGGVVLPTVSDSTSAEVADDEDRERDDGQDDEDCPQHCETPSG